MRDRAVIAAGLAMFLVMATFPVWYNVAARANAVAPALARPSEAAVRRVRTSVRSGFGRISVNPPEGGSHEMIQACVAPRDFMRASHMQLLVSWRDDVVRRNERVFVAYDGHRYEKNLLSTCLGCHEDKTKFCDRCHDYAGVSPRCADCHQAGVRTP